MAPNPEARAPGIGDTAFGHDREALFGRRVDDLVAGSTIAAPMATGFTKQIMSYWAILDWLLSTLARADINP